MDMKRILQALDGVSTKPVVGVNDMAKFLSIVDKNASVEVLNEGKDPHKVTLPVQMAMQHYQKPEVKKPTVVKVTAENIVSKYFHKVEEEFAEEKQRRRNLINQYAGVIAERVMMKESDLSHTSLHNGPGLETPPDTGGHYGLGETPIEFDKENPVASTIHSHNKANPGSIEYRIMRARRQLQDLAKQAESNELSSWEHIVKLFPELAMNIDQIQHGIEELAKIRKAGGRRTGNIPKNIGESKK